MALLMAAFSAIALMATHLLSSRPTATIDCLCELWLALVNTATQEGELMGDRHVTPPNLDNTLSRRIQGLLTLTFAARGPALLLSYHTLLLGLASLHITSMAKALPIFFDGGQSYDVAFRKEQLWRRAPSRALPTRRA